MCLNLNMVKKLTVSINKRGVFGKEAVEVAVKQLKEIDDMMTKDLSFNTNDINTLFEFVLALNEGPGASLSASVTWALEQVVELKKLEPSLF